MLGKRDGRKCMDHAAWQATISDPTEIPGAMRGVKWGEKEIGRGIGGRLTQI